MIMIPISQSLNIPISIPGKPERAAHTNSPLHVQHLFQLDALRVGIQRQPPGKGKGLGSMERFAREDWWTFPAFLKP